jgi:L,D-transpeptidase YcbB
VRARAALLLVATVLAGHHVGAAQTLSERVRQRLSAEPRDRVRPLLVRFYAQRSYRPAWVSDSGPLPVAAALVGIIEAAGTEGLDPNDYPHGRIRALLGRGHPPDTLARLDLLLSRAFLAYGSDLSLGRVDPAAVDSSWTAARRSVDVVAALDSGGAVATLERLAPPQLPYAMLRRALLRYREIAALGGWPAVPAGPELAPGVRDPRVAVLRTRLVDEGYLGPGEGTGDLDDAAVAGAVWQFQARHGLEPDGVVGPATLAALNVAVERRIHQIELNLERWRWLPRALGDRYVMVNSAAFVLEVVESEQQVMTMRAVVGRRDWPTPIVSGQITGLIFSPVWHIPRNIALKEVLPLFERDSTYLLRHGITISMDSSTFALQLEQAPGKDNPLGGVKIIFGSRFNVGIHDTPARSLFQQRVRTFSHGCIRVEGAADLATYLLQDSVRWTADSVRARMARTTEQVVPLSRPIPVHLTYWTAWVDDDGTLQFRDDVYGWDGKLATLLRSRRPRPAP